MFSTKNLIRILINTGIGVLLVFFWLKLVDIREIIKELQKVNLLLTLPFILFFLVSGILRALRLKILLNNFQKTSLKNLTFLTFLGQLLSFSIPLRVGEVAKGVYLSTEYKLPPSKSVVWIFLDRFFDFWVVLLLALILLLLIPTQLPGNLVPILIFLIGGLSLAVSFVIFLPKVAKNLVNIVSHILVLEVLKRFFQKITHFLIDSASFLNQGKATLLAILITILALISDAASWYVMFLAVFGPTEILTIFLGSLLSMLTYIIPAAPGYVGSAEASGVAVFSLGLGYDKTLVSVVTLIFHAITLVTILGVGLISLYFLKFDLKLVLDKFKKN